MCYFSQNSARAVGWPLCLLFSISLSQVSAYGFMTPDYAKYSDHYYDKKFHGVAFYANHDFRLEMKLWQELHRAGLLKLYMRQWLWPGQVVAIAATYGDSQGRRFLMTACTRNQQLQKAEKTSHRDGSFSSIVASPGCCPNMNSGTETMFYCFFLFIFLSL